MSSRSLPLARAGGIRTCRGLSADCLGANGIGLVSTCSVDAEPKGCPSGGDFLADTFSGRWLAARIGSGSAFEFPAGLKLFKLVCDDTDVEAATIISNWSQMVAHPFSVGNALRLV
jgi:hypothetical protein